MSSLQPNYAEHSDAEYRTIEAALLESARGRWFLSEHGRRARRLDSALLEDAIGRLQKSLRDPPALLGQLQVEIEAIRTGLEATRTELLSRAPTPAEADGQQSQAILKAAEDIHELAWSLQANPFDPQGCEQIARNAGKLYALSQSQAIHSERMLAFAASLDGIAARLDGILETVAHEMTIDSSK
jgi:hypothetical protein